LTDEEIEYSIDHFSTIADLNSSIHPMKKSPVFYPVLFSCRRFWSNKGREKPASFSVIGLACDNNYIFWV